MAKGKNRMYNVAVPGQITSQLGPDYNYLYRASTVRDDKYWPGDVVTLGDRREFTYAKSSAACISGQGCEFTYTGYVAYTAFAVAAVIGDMEITIPAATHAALTEDELRNGYVCIFLGDTTNNVEFRQIVGNVAADANAAFKVQLDAKLTQTIVASTSAVEAYRNPYNGLRTGTDDDFPKAGVPAVKVAAADTYFWVQTRGMIWVAPQANLGNAGGLTGGFWHDVGNVSDGATALGGLTIPNAKSCQYAGYCVSGSISGNGPLFFLTG